MVWAENKMCEKWTLGTSPPNIRQRGASRERARASRLFYGMDPGSMPALERVQQTHRARKVVETGLCGQMYDSNNWAEKCRHQTLQLGWKKGI